MLVGVASASAGLSGVAANDLPPDALLDGIQVAFVVAAGMSALAVGASLLRALIIGQVLALSRVQVP